MFYNARDNAIGFIRCYGGMILEVKNRQENKKEQDLKSELPIALAQVKAGNNSESLLNEIREIVYSLYRSKELLKKYTTT